MNMTRPNNSRIQSGLLFALVSILVLLSACNRGAEPDITVDPSPTIAPTVDTGPTQPVRGQAQVDEVEILIMESFPVQVSVIARGELPDSCTRIDEIISQRTEDTFRVAITTFRQPDTVCTQVIVPFDQTIALDVVGLPAGTYNVTVNGVPATFTLDVDNILSEDAEPTPDNEIGVGGFVWHDLCAFTGSPVEAEADPPQGCVVAPDGRTYVANGTREDNEPGIPGVQIRLLAGDCTSAAPGEEITITTDESGAYRFPAVTPADYCVYFDTADEVNAPLLEEGVLTAPVVNNVATNSVSVTLLEGVAPDDINFGYDYRFRPVPEAAADCTNSFEFVLDLTVPDNTIIPPGVEFEAAWRLRNNGTCPWTTEYGVTFVGGDPMGDQSTIALTESVAPGQTSDVSVIMTAPDVEGTFRSNWQLSDAEGNPFGINGQIEDAFWVQIIVQEGAEFIGTPVPGSAAVGGIVWNDVCFLTNGQPSRGCVETEPGSGFYRADGSLNFGERPITGITVILGRGACPEGGIPAPADRLATQVTDEEGRYRFEGLEAGIYCVSIDALGPENVDLLIPGNWTYPAPGTGRAGIRLAQGEERLTIDFGWDYQE
jgi:hypothetical protein